LTRSATENTDNTNPDSCAGALIHDRLADSGRIGVHVVLRGTIESGAGAGDRISAQARAGPFKFSCRIVAESFAPGGLVHGIAQASSAKPTGH
jgi:hypothetical protein